MESFPDNTNNFYHECARIFVTKKLEYFVFLDVRKKCARNKTKNVVFVVQVVFPQKIESSVFLDVKKEMREK